MQKVINRVAYIIQIFQQHLKEDRLKELEPKLIELTKVSERVEKKHIAASQEAKEFLYFHEEASKLGYIVNSYQYKLLTTTKEYLRKGKIKFDIVNFKCKCSKDINAPHLLCKRD